MTRAPRPLGEADDAAMIPGARLIILGRQGAGKGTQCVRLSRHFVVPHISTGDMLRAAVREGTELGRLAKQVMDDGGLVGDEIMVGIVEERLDRDDARSRGYILDGFPRTVGQAGAARRDHRRAPDRRGASTSTCRASWCSADQRPAGVPRLRHELRRDRQTSGSRGSARCAVAT